MSLTIHSAIRHSGPSGTTVYGPGDGDRLASEVAADEIARLREIGLVSGEAAPVRSLEDHTVAELKEIAENLGIEGISNVKKAALIKAIEAAEPA